MSPAFVESDKAADLSSKNQLEEATFFDKFDHLSIDRHSEGGAVSSDDDFELPVLVRLENERLRKK